jgi:hypothetical protein
MMREEPSETMTNNNMMGLRLPQILKNLEKVVVDK